jgi:hypothetical protein
MCLAELWRMKTWACQRELMGGKKLRGWRMIEMV